MIEKHIEEARRSCLNFVATIFDDLLLRAKNEAAQKAEMVEKLVERMDLQKELPAERFNNLCRYTIEGYKGKEVTAATISSQLAKEGLTITTEQELHLAALRGLRKKFLDKKTTIATALKMDFLSEEEREIFEAWAKTLS